MHKQILLILLSILLLCGCSESKKTTEDVKAVDTIPLLVMQIQKTSRLYTTEYHLHKIITHTDKKQLKGTFLKKDFSIDLPLGERQIAIPMDATVKAYVDFSHFSEKNVNKKGQKLEIILPDPRIVITSTRINHEEVKQYVAITRSNFSDAELTSYEQQGRKQIEQAIPQMGIVEQARESAAHILIPMFTQMGYDENDITITFRKKFTANDFSVLMDKTTVEKNGKKQ